MKSPEEELFYSIAKAIYILHRICFPFNYCDKIFSDSPTGKPNVEPTTSSKHTGEQVVLLCNNPVDDGNPDCDVYTWNRVEGSIQNPGIYNE